MSEQKEYQVVNGTYFDARTPGKVCDVLEEARASGRRIRLFYGNGRVWGDEYDVLGFVGRSTGGIKIPLLIKNQRSMGGGGILDHCIVRIQDVATKRVLYDKPGVEWPEFEVRSGLSVVELPFEVVQKDRGVVARFSARRKADHWIDFMLGKRMRAW
jgi:hypothetical protein